MDGQYTAFEMESKMNFTLKHLGGPNKKNIFDSFLSAWKKKACIQAEEANDSQEANTVDNVPSNRLPVTVNELPALKK